jgi:hypothetical protein
MTSRLSSIAVWVLVIIGVVLVVSIAAPSAYFPWLAIVLAGAILATFVIQLALPSKEGLVLRMMASIGGAVVLLAIATVVVFPFTR